MKHAIFLVISCLCIGLISAESKWKLIGTEAEFDEHVKSAGNGLVVAKFFATWCGPCKAITPALERTALKYENIPMIKIDVDEVMELAMKFKVTSLPTFVFLKNGEALETFTGTDLGRFVKAIDKYNE